MNINKYAMNLYRHQELKGLTNQEIGDILNEKYGTDYTESKWRKMYKYGYKFYDAGVAEAREETDYDVSIMVMNDIHLPYEREDVLEVINKHKNEITHLVIAGDLLDNHSISFFDKIEDTTLEEELVYAHKWLNKVREILDNNQEIILINGNHEERWEREIKKMHQKNMQKFINPNILEMLVEGFTIYHNGSKRQYDGIEGVTFVPHWFVNLSDRLIVAHPKNFSQVDGRMCENVVAHFANRGEEFDAVIFGHTHKYSEMKVSRRGGKYAVENGCMCKPQDYADTGKLNFTPQDYCYTIVKWNYEEKLDINNIIVYHLDSEVIDNTLEV